MPCTSNAESRKEATAIPAAAKANLLGCPKTPSFGAKEPNILKHPETPVCRPAADVKDALRACGESVKALRKEARAISPIKQKYLTKESNLKSFTAFEVDDRLQKMDEQFKNLESMVKGTLEDRTKMEDSIKTVQGQGMSPSLWGTAALSGAEY